MKWNELKPGDMILIVGNGFMKLFKGDVFIIVGVQSTIDSIDVQMLSSCHQDAKTKKHRMNRDDISPVFNVFRNGQILN